MDERLAALEHDYNELAEKLESIKKTGIPKKDFWDIVAATTPLVTGLLISGIGLYFAYTNNQAQLKLQETQTVEKFIPHLIGSEPEKKAAIIAISTITNTETAAKYAELFPSEGTASALKSIASNSNSKDSDKKLVTRALVNTFHQMADTYQATQNTPAAEQAYSQSISEQEKLVGKDSPELVDNLNRLADTYKTQKKYALAEVALKRVVQIQERTTGSRSPQFIESLNRLAQALKQEGKVDTANHISDYAQLLATQTAVSESTDKNSAESKAASNVAQDIDPKKQTPTAPDEVLSIEAPPKSEGDESSNKHNGEASSSAVNPAPGSSAPAASKEASTVSTATNLQKPTL